MSAKRKLLLIGLDAADPELVGRWIDDGTLRHLGSLKRAGAHGRLRTSARFLAGSPWPTFYTGQPPSRHGIYHDFQWRHERAGYAAPAADWLPARPFWREMRGGARTVACDVPMTLGCEPFEGLEITGWASHDNLAPPQSHPAELLPRIRREFGAWPIEPEAFGRSSVEELLALRQQLIETTRRSSELARWLLRVPWDLGVVAFSALHRGGHRLWDRSSIAGAIPAGLGERFDAALRDLYVAGDEAVGEVLAAAGAASVIVFSLHGMMANTTRVDLLEGMLRRVLADGEDERPRRPGRLRRAGEILPLGLRRFLTSRVPAGLRDRLMTLWAAGGVDWERTEAFALRADLQGYVRVNLKGREPRGIVPPGEACDRLLGRIEEGLLSFRDSTTGEPFVEGVHRAERLFPEGRRSDRLPDLIVCWKETPAGGHDAVESPRFGRVERSTPGRIPNGRSANHRPEGLLLACGDGIRAGAEVEGADILDLAPTVLRLLGVEPPMPLAGRVIPELAGGS